MKGKTRIGRLLLSLLLTAVMSVLLLTPSGCAGNGSDVPSPVSSVTALTAGGTLAVPQGMTDVIWRPVDTVAKGLSVASDKAAMRALRREAEKRYRIVVYKGSQSVVVYRRDKDGKYTKEDQIFTCSTGIDTSPTPSGSYKIGYRVAWCKLVGDVYGQYSCFIARHYLFHSVPYLKQNVSTLDNAEYDKLGQPASHGCIRMCVRDCKWIYDNCPYGTPVEITDESGPEGSGVPARRDDPAYDGWDPSDKWAANNPYFT